MCAYTVKVERLYDVGVARGALGAGTLPGREVKIYRT